MNKNNSPCPQEPEPSEQGQVTHTQGPQKMERPRTMRNTNLLLREYQGRKVEGPLTRVRATAFEPGLEELERAAW